MCCQCLHYHQVNLSVVSVCIITKSTCVLSVSALSPTVNRNAVSVCTTTNSQPVCCQCLHYHQQSTCVLSVSALPPTVNLCVVSVSTITNNQHECCQCVVISVCVSQGSTSEQFHRLTLALLSTHSASNSPCWFSCQRYKRLKNTGGESKAIGFPCPKLFCYSEKTSFLHPVQAVARC